MLSKIKFYNINQLFKENPQNLKFRHYLTTNYCCS